MKLGVEELEEDRRLPSPGLEATAQKWPAFPRPFVYDDYINCKGAVNDRLDTKMSHSTLSTGDKLHWRPKILQGTNRRWFTVTKHINSCKLRVNKKNATIMKHPYLDTIYGHDKKKYISKYIQDQIRTWRCKQVNYKKIISSSTEFLSKNGTIYR